jgi:glycosyltransferase involved in cell wall biosynthesis
MQEPLVTTIIPVFNRAAMLRRSVDSVLAQTYRHIELIIVDDGSEDETARVADELALAHPEIIRVIHKENAGPGLAREAGRQQARGDFIQYLDSDDWLLPNKFRDQVAALKQNPHADIIYGITQLVDEQGNILKAPSKDTGVRRSQLFPALLVDRWWHTATPIYSKRISDLAGEWYAKRPEDWDLEARMAAYNPQLAYVDKPVSCHLEHDMPGRVSRGKIADYLLDEAWFLPRLYRCAIQAGVAADAPEMQHFSKWAFMRARHLGAMGETKLAEQLFELSLEAAQSPSAYQKLSKALASIIGWVWIGRLGRMLEAFK